MTDPDFAELRIRMVEAQLIARGITNELVLKAFNIVPRHAFVPPEHTYSAYHDYPLPIGEGQTISQPYMVALMTERLSLKGGEKVLEVGTGSGYQTAILSRIVDKVYSIERLPILASKASNTLSLLGYDNCTIYVGDGTLGYQDHAPYDAIIVTAGSPCIPDALIGQLKLGAKMVIPLGDGASQTLTVIERSNSGFTTTEVCGCVFVPLIGKEGWPEKRDSH